MTTSRERLLTARDELAASIVTAAGSILGPKDVASLSREYRMVLDTLGDHDDTRHRLAAVRDLIDACLPMADTNVLAALSREYRAVIAALDGLPDPNAAKSTIDELKERRDNRTRHSDAADSVGSA